MRRVVAVAAAAVVAVTMWATRRGPGLSPDSVAYLSAGQSLADGHGLRGLDGAPFTLWPPGFPALLAAGRTVGLGLENTSRLLTALSFAAVVVVAWLLLRNATRGRGAAMVGTAVVATAPALLGIARYAWSDALFVAVSSSLALLLAQVARRRHLDAWRATAIIALCWSGFLLRYAGVTLAATTVLVLLVALPGRERWTRVAAVGAAAVALPALWAVRNHRLDGTVFGPRTPSPDTPVDAVRRVAATTGEWALVVSKAPSVVQAVAGLAVLAVVVFAAVRVVRRQPPTSPELAVLLAWVGVYVGYLLLAQVTTAIDPIDNRLMSPVFVPLVVILVAVGEWAVAGRPRWLSGAVLAAVSLFLVAQAANTASMARSGGREGIGLGRVDLDGTQLADAVHQMVPADAVQYTNDPPRLWALTGRRPLQAAPRVLGLRNSPVEGELAAFAQTVGCADSPVYLALFEPASPRDVPFDELAAAVDLDLVVATDDGSLYRVSADCAATGTVAP